MTNLKHSQKSYLRAEAGAFKWENLTEPQQKALEKIAQFLRHDCEVLDEARDRESDVVDRARFSRVAFIDADRGMGKTSVLVTLKKFIVKGELQGLPVSPETDALRWLQGSHGRIHWLETLDMEPLPKDTNLLAAILVRIEDALKLDGARSFLDDLDARETTAAEMAQLQQDAVLSWQGLSPKRINSVDPSTAAQEVLTTERAALELNKRLGFVLHKLSQSLKTNAGDPIFLLPVDDFDLAPAKCLELLRIIRMVTTPRLFFLIAGNTRMAQEMLRLQSEGELATLVGRMTDQSFRRIQKTAIEISANNLRKLIPPSQRINLQLLTLEQALKMSLPNLGTYMRSTGELVTLQSILEEVHVDLNYLPEASRKTTLMEHFAPDYSGSRWLRGTPRQNQDRADLFRRHMNDSDDWGESLLREIIDEVKAEINEDGHLDSASGDAVQELFRNDAGELRLDFRKHFTLEFGGIESIRIDGVGRDIFQLGLRLHVPNRAEWHLRQVQRVSAPAGPRAGDSLTFIHDLAISLWGGYVEENSILYSNLLSFQLGETRWQLEGMIADIMWPLPEWWTIRSQEVFWHRFRQLIYPKTGHQDILGADQAEGESAEERTMERTPQGYIAACIEASLVTLGAMDSTEAQRHSGRSAHTKTDGYRSLAKGVAKLLSENPTREARKYTIESAIVNIALLLAPETGINIVSPTFCDEILGQIFRTTKSRSKYVGKISRARAARLANALKPPGSRMLIKEETISKFLVLINSDTHDLNGYCPIIEEDIFSRIQRN